MALDDLPSPRAFPKSCTPLINDKTLRALHASGFAVVPLELTSGMNAVGQHIMETGQRNVIGQPLPTLRNIYRAMIQKFIEDSYAE